MLTTERLCLHIIQLLHAPIRVYNTAGKQTAIYADHNEQQDVLACDTDYLTELLEKAQREAPFIHLETDEIIYGAVKDTDNIYLLGPCCIGQNPAKAARQLVRRHQMNPQRPHQISSVSLHDFIELMLMLHEQLTGSEMEFNKLLMRSFCDQAFELAMQENFHRVFFALRESCTIHNPYDQEMRDFENIC